jgi:hypothetical protein
MSGNSKKITVAMLGLGVSLLAFNHAFARDVGDSNYPVAGQEKMSKEQMKAQHEKMLKQTDAAYQEKMNALNERYKEKVTNEEINRKMMMEKRKEEAILTKERMEKRAQMDRRYQEQKSKLENEAQTKAINRYYQAQKDVAEDRKDGVEHYHQVGMEPTPPAAKKQDMMPIQLEGEKGNMPPPPTSGEMKKDKGHEKWPD